MRKSSTIFPRFDCVGVQAITKRQENKIKRVTLNFFMLPYCAEPLRKSRMFRYFTHHKARLQKARQLFERAETQARLPMFYVDMGVPDTIDGRFDMICLHCYLLMHRLNKLGDKESKKLAQKLFDVLFRQMDFSLRELGIGDLSVPKHMKRMMQGFNGRAHNYAQAIYNDDRPALENALINNVYGTLDYVDPDHVSAMADYVLANTAMPNVDDGFAPIKMKSKGIING